MKQQGLKGKYQDGKNTVTVNVPVMLFEEDNTHIAYIPVLDLSGYGKTEQEAKDSLGIVLNEYFSYTIRKNTLAADLRAHGWTVKKKTKPFIAPEITELLDKNAYLHDILNQRAYRMDRMDVSMPQYAELLMGFKLTNLPLSTVQKILEHQGCKFIRKNNGHFKYSKANLLRPIVIQTHIDPVPGFIVKQIMRTLGLTDKDMEKILSEI